MTGFTIKGNARSGEIWKDDKLIERCPSKAIALDRARELMRAQAKGETLRPAGVKTLSELPWKDPLRVRQAGSWVGSWNEGAAVLTNASTGNMANLTRDELERRFEPEDGGNFEPGVGGGVVVERKTFEALRTEGPVVDQVGVTYAGKSVRYIVRDPETGREEVHAEDEFDELFEVVEAPKPIKPKAPSAPKTEEL